MKIEYLMLELTRRCNQNCKHCLRGSQQALTLDTSLFNNLFDGILNVDKIVFTGGEPSLNIDAIRETLSFCKTHKIQVNSIYIATNGLENQKQFIQAIEIIFQSQTL